MGYGYHIHVLRVVMSTCQIDRQRSWGRRGREEEVLLRVCFSQPWTLVVVDGVMWWWWSFHSILLSFSHPSYRGFVMSICCSAIYPVLLYINRKREGKHHHHTHHIHHHHARKGSRRCMLSVLKEEREREESPSSSPLHRRWFLHLRGCNQFGRWVRNMLPHRKR